VYGRRVPHNPNLVPFLVACLGIALFCVMDTLMKGMVLSFGVYNAMLWRSIVGTGLGGSLYLLSGRGWPTRAVVRLHLWRGAVVAGMALLWFWSLAHLPLAEAIALSFIAPLIALYLAAVMLGEKIGRSAIIASLLGLAGVVIMVGARISAAQPDRDALWGAAAVFGSAILYAYNLILARQQAQVAKPAEIAFFQSATISAIFAAAAPWLAILPDAADWPAIIAASVLTITSLLLLSWAYARTEAQVLIPVEYTGFVWLALLGWAVFGEELTLPVLAGTALIVTGSLIAARAQTKDAAGDASPGA
jgi:S-adenosylmethionine uptake transporter